MPTLPTSEIATACPLVDVAAAPVSFAAAATTPGGSTPTAKSFSAGETATVPGKLNENAARLDAAIRFALGSVHAICAGLALSAGAGLTLNIAAGQAAIEGLAELAAASTLVLTDNDDNYIYLLQTGTITAVVGTTAAPSSPPSVYLGRATTYSGAITIIDDSGVVRVRGGVPVRATNDVDAPTDTPPAEALLLTKTPGGTFLWDGTSHLRLMPAGSPGLAGTRTVPLAKLTPSTGSDGSLTFVNGILTAATDPT